eukprot:CAMPEP_0196723720 /NCGR_PEP_ID=MMETSP1091-20130531/5794_1 /TAXON_ID=302021 /ORGANISM="Rhodomonas sp., Strain CCMP768" /LENGTH=170 /DNA_ID=CAMNT_0042065711 /DNA_START=33 /DNA_END=543 /DNA_ORIENTATION=+
MSSRRERAKFMLRPVILFNPFLEAIHPTATETRKVAPMFMSDFQMVYFLEPCIMQLAQGDNVVETSLFKAHPHNWQLWAREAPRGYTKVWEESVVPTAVDKAMLRDVRDRSRAPKGGDHQLKCQWPAGEDLKHCGRLLYGGDMSSHCMADDADAEKLRLDVVRSAQCTVW